MLLDSQTQRIQDLLQRNASGDHLKKTLFTGEQRLSSFALADVYRGTDITIDFARLPDDRSAYALHMLNRSICKDDSKFQVEPLFFANGFIETSFDK